MTQRGEPFLLLIPLDLSLAQSSSPSELSNNRIPPPRTLFLLLFRRSRSSPVLTSRIQTAEFGLRYSAALTPTSSLLARDGLIFAELNASLGTTPHPRYRGIPLVR